MVTFDPFNGAQDIPANRNVIITFSEPVRKIDNSELTNTDLVNIISLKASNASGGDFNYSASINNEKTLYTFKNKIKNLSKKLKQKINTIKRQGKTIHIYGASTKGNVLIQYSKLSVKDIDFAADRNPEKWSKKMPGSNIPIISEKDSRSLNPDAYLVLPWHFKKEFVKREKNFLAKGGELIFPLPKIYTLSKKHLKL